MWEDGFCRGRVSDCLEEIEGEDPVRKAFSKMSIQLYNYGEGWVLGRCFFLNIYTFSGVWFLSCLSMCKIWLERYYLFIYFFKIKIFALIGFMGMYNQVDGEGCI